MNLAGKRVVITGGAGFIGSHLVRELAPASDVIVIDDFSTGTRENLAGVPGLTVREADVADPATFRDALEEADVIFHLAVRCLRSSIGDPLGTHHVNTLGTVNLLLEASAARVERFVYVSSSEVYGDAISTPMDEDHPLNPRTPYAASKLAGEAYARSFERTYGLPVVVVRPFNAYGPRSHLDGASGELIPRFVARAAAGLPLVIFGDGHQTRNFTWVEETAAAIRLAGETDVLVGETVNVAHGQPVSVLEIAHRVVELLGSSAPIVHRCERPGDVRCQHAGTRRAAEVMGFEAAVSIEEGLRRYIAWVQAQPQRSLRAPEEVVNWSSMSLD
jgi:UDP-glucose 4-epimerase